MNLDELEYKITDPVNSDVELEKGEYIDLVQILDQALTEAFKGRTSNRDPMKDRWVNVTVGGMDGKTPFARTFEL